MTPRPLITATLAAPILACTTLSPILAGMKLGPLDMVPFGAAILPMIFAVPGSLFLTIVFLLLTKARTTLRYRYLALLIIAPITGALALGSYDRLEILLGALYAAVTAILWIVIHRWQGRRAASRTAP